MEWIDEMHRQLDQGLYVHNLRRMAECCDLGMKGDPKHRLGAYVMRSVLGDLQRDWDGRAVQVDEVRQAEAVLKPALLAVLARVRSGDAEAVELDALVRVWMTL